MRKILFVTVCVYALFLAEFFLYNVFAPWFKPDFLLLFVIFLNFLFGIRYSIFAAVLAGLFKDSFSITPFGINIISFVFCSYMTVILKKYIYRYGSLISRLLLIFVILLINGMTQYILRSIFGLVPFWAAFRFVMLPEIFSTMVVSNLTFRFYKKCASKSFV